MFYKVFSRFIFPVLIIIAIFTRFYGLNWGFPNYFHPDENNMATAISQFSNTNLDPHFYAYGQFPLYLSYFVGKLFNTSNSLGDSILVLRFLSACFSLAALYFFYLSAKIVFPKIARFFLLLMIFTPGLIQLAHFGTTESLLIFVFAINTFLSLKYYQSNNPNYLLIASIFTGIGLATKITAIFFALPLFFSLILSFKKKSFRLVSIIFFLQFISLSFIFFLILSPYNWINFYDFWSAMRYETSVATGELSIFYTTQFKDSIPYLFQFKNIFPQSSGIIIFIFSFLSIIFLPRLKIKTKLPYLFILFLPALIYFLYFGQLYVKWFRFMSPLFFIGAFFAAIFISHFKSRVLQLSLTVLAILPGVIYFSHYFFPDIRQSSSQWLTQNIPTESIILSEGGNVVNFPLNQSGYKITHFDFYSETDFSSDLVDQIKLSDYIIVPSRRVFKNYSNSDYPVINSYYQKLFSSDLGFDLIKTFSPIGDFILNSESAEETWSVFDRPTIRIYKNNHSQSNVQI
jgi:4-amino-4-deoxy-L-arabinose transferase-like glycosyltransferase